MRGLKNLLLEERNRLEKIIKVVQVELKTMPEGSLRLSKSKEYIQYYHCTEENKLGKYIVKGNDELIQALAQKSYDEKYQGKGFQEGIPLILTDRGERVRSKTEKIMADYFYRKGIEYKYEQPIYLKGLGTVYPDFTFFSKRVDGEMYWEHCGMIDSPEYARNMVRKIEMYEKNGIFPGERLILTYETEQSILGTEKIAQMVERYLL